MTTISQAQTLTKEARHSLFEQGIAGVANAIEQVAKKGFTNLTVRFYNRDVPLDELYQLTEVSLTSYELKIHPTITSQSIKEYFENKGFTLKVGSYGITKDIILSYAISWDLDNA